jgi:hypothetical protein
VVTARYLSYRFLKPLHEKQREERRQKGSGEPRKKDWKEEWKAGWTAGWREGWNEGREEGRRQWAAWNLRRMEAERNGEFFHEPPPESERIQHQASKE